MARDFDDQSRFPEKDAPQHADATPQREQTPANTAAKADTPADDAPATTGGKRGKAKRAVIGLLLIALLGAGLWKGYDWWTVGRFVESTDDAYAKADIATFSAQVAGPITEIDVADNARVAKGDVLMRIDDTPYKAALDQAQAEVAGAQAAIDSIDAQITLQDNNIASANASLNEALAARKLARTNAERSHKLLARGTATQANTDQKDLALDQAEASVKKAQAALDVARGQVPVLKTQRRQQQAALRRAQAAVIQAQQNLDDTVIRASRDGVVGNRGIEVGEYVRPGTRLISLVPLNDVYVLANFKETQVAHFRPGLRVSMTSDMLDGAHVTGTIDSIAPAAGSEFALLPTENATGNFTKIVQRIPVRIHIDPPADDQGPRLRPGTSVVVDVNTRPAQG